MNLLALAILTFAPVIQFTSDSVYTNDKVLTYTVEQEEDLSYTMYLEENDTVVGYMIYDNSDTEYIDGLQVDGAWVYDWKVENIDITVEHNISIKTVYSDDVAGMLAAAANGDFSTLLSNPITLLQLVYYVLAAISVVVSGIVLAKSKGKRIKSANEIGAIVSTEANTSLAALTTKAIEIVVDIVVPVFQKLKSQNQAVLEALILSRNGDAESTKALIDLIKSSASEDITVLADSIKAKVSAEAIAAATKLDEIKTAITEIAKDDEQSSGSKYDGTSI